MGYIFAVDEAIEKLITSLSEAIGWKYLKSQRCLKKTVGDLVFEIDFYSSKWNSSHERVEINAGFSMWNKSYDKKLNVNSVTATLMYTPEDSGWFDISTEDKLKKVFVELKERFENTAVYLADMFEQDRTEAAKKLLDEHFYEYNVHFDLIADILGKDAIKNKAQELYDRLSAEEKQQAVDYINGAKNKSWMLNRSNLRYIIDNGIITLG
ncbi:MAG: hypothetical protein K6F71_10340 [Ruminococcus sp.]|uniref:hypothetical protein n=1 Tax=Ruminococcus sp. TaxID=41978 RepID=UPI0025CCF646|nr:hypothetical protein [Ruminococcus sp.]MCR5541196.1 hypothetical protein [Ruminococcus sp.]